MKRVFSLPNRTHGQGPIYFNWQKGGGNFLVTTGHDHSVSIYNRHGVKVDQINMPGMVTGMEWDKDGDLLGLICDKSPSIVIWDSNTRRISQIDTGLRDALSLILWAKTSPLVAVGTFKGNLLIYNHRSSRKVPVLGKHSKRITAGAWSSQGYLALAGEDRVLTVSNQDGDTLCQTSLKADPALAAFSCMKQDSASTSSAATENTVSLILNKRTLFLLNIYDPENPILLAFQEKYGYIIDYKWYDDGNILLGFTQGFFVIISTLLKDIGQELFQVKSQKENMTHLSVVSSQNKVASCGENTIKVHELHELQEVAAIVTVDEERQLEWLDWTDDGQLLAVAGAEGGLHVFLAKLPALASSWLASLAYLSSLREVSVVTEPQASPVKLRLEVEPSLLGLGPFHMAAGLHNRAWFYCLDQKGPYLMKEREYLGTISSICLNADYASALFEGKIQLHLIEEMETDEKEARLFPNGNFSNIHISCHALTKDFLIYGTDTGQLHYFLLEDWQEVNHFSHSTGIKLVSPEPAGVRLILVDDHNQGFIYNPSTDALLAIPDFPSKIKEVLWDQCPMTKGVFIGYDEHSVYTYVETKDSLKGWLVEGCGKTKLPAGQFPVLLYSGDVHCQTQSGKMAVLTLSSHLLLHSNLRDNSKLEVKETLERAIKLKDFTAAWGLCQRLDNKEDWILLADAATFSLDVDLAIRVYSHLGDVSMVWDLRSIKDLEDKSLLAGHLAMFQGDFTLAEQLYLASRSPSAALAMRCDLLHWEPALQLARSLAPLQLPFISRQYALQLEFMGDYANALLHYEKGITNSPEHVEHDNICKMGVARTSIRCNNVQRGFQIAQSMDNRNLKKECAEILENMKQYSEAAMMYESAHYIDRATSLYIKLKNWTKVGELVAQCTSPRLQLQYAKAKEADGSYQEAVKAYALAQEYDNVIRIYLDHLNNPEAAVTVVKETKSLEGAKMVAKFFQKLNDVPTAIQFLALSRCHQEAFQLAQSTGQMEVYAEVVEGGSPRHLAAVAQHYEAQRSHTLAGKFYARAGMHKQTFVFNMSSSKPSGSKTKRKIADEHRNFQEKWELEYFCSEVKDKIICLICNNAISVPKLYNIKRHYEQHKSKYDTYEGLMRQEKLKEFKLGMKKQQFMFTKVSQESEAAVHASYVLSEMIAKHSKSFTEGDFIKECLIKAAEMVCPGSVKTFQAISLSRNTIVERVTDMARHLNDQIKEKSSCFEAFSIACDESTDIGGVAQLAVFFELATRISTFLRNYWN
ncbi:WDR19 [Cordylochernes scorpioides]|uniref:WDR19 n=1 Tax=Cordylochernes scorpioides TaxID=51811 RepID=A0ABY6K6W1_9ARAC|nr:WDR19 [Cordylochernes scorpioides]